MLKGLTNTFKQGCNNIELTYSEYIKLDNQTIPIKAQLKDDTYENGNFIGTFILKQITFETEATYNFRNKEFEYYKVVNGESIKIGTFISTDITINDTTEVVKVIGMDYGLKTQVEYTSALDYASGEITLKDVWNECCSLSGLESGIKDFPNSDFIVDSDQFTGTGATIRDVFKAIAMSSGTFVKIMNDDKIYLIFNELTSDIEEVEINGSATIQDGYKLVDLTLQGDTSQASTPTPSSPQPINVVSGRQVVSVIGRNYFDNSKPYTYQTINNYSETTIPTGKRITWISSSNFTYQFLGYVVMDLTNHVGKTIRFKTDFSASGNNIGSYYIGLCNADGSNRKTKASTTTSGNTISFTVPELVGEQKYLCVALYVNLTGTLAQNDYVDYTNIMLTIDDSNMTYEVYKGKSYEINLGKNILDTSTITSGTYNGVDYENNNGTITLDGTATANSFIATSSSRPYILEAGTYTISANNETTVEGTNNFIRLVNLQGTAISGTSANFTVANNHSTFTLTEKTTARFQIRTNVGTTYDNFVFKPQLEKGSEATSYSPYKTPIELCKIENYTDHIFKAINGDSVYDNLSSAIKETLTYGGWYLEKQIGKIVLNGSENWTTQKNTSPYVFALSFDNYKRTQENICKCNYFESVVNSGYGDLTDGKICFRYNSGDNNKYLYICTTLVSSYSDFKTWLSSHNAIVYYVLATPTYTEITDSELIEQLNAPRLFEGLNNISITSGDLSSPLKLSYYTNELDTIEDYVELEDKRDTHPWTCLRLGTTQIEGNNLDYIDQDLVDKYGENWLILNDNPFAYNQEKRSQLIENIFNQIKEFGYSAFVSKTTFKPYLTSGDIIRFKNRDGEFVKSILLRYNYNYEDLTLEAPSETSATVNYVRPQDTTQMIKNIQIIVNQDTQEINSINQNINTLSQMVDSQGNDIDTLGTVLTQTTESITANVSAIQETLENGVDLVKTTSVSINNNGINVSTDLSKIATIISNNAFKIVPKGSTEPLAFFGYDEEQNISVAKMDNLTITTYLNTGAHRIEKYEEDGEERTGFFYIGG